MRKLDYIFIAVCCLVVTACEVEFDLKGLDDDPLFLLDGCVEIDPYRYGGDLQMYLYAVPSVSGEREFSEEARCTLKVYKNSELIDIKDTDITIRLGTVNLRTTADKVRKISKATARKAANNPSFLRKNIMNDLNEKAANFNLTLDLRGKQGEEALNETEKYIDEAVLLSIKEVNILHGKGNGILRRIIRDFLSKNSNIKEFHDATLETGGTGITKVTLK